MELDRGNTKKPRYNCIKGSYENFWHVMWGFSG